MYNEEGIIQESIDVGVPSEIETRARRLLADGRPAGSAAVVVDDLAVRVRDGRRAFRRYLKRGITPTCLGVREIACACNVDRAGLFITKRLQTIREIERAFEFYGRTIARDNP